MIVNYAAAQSAMYHIKAIERKLSLVKQYINPRAGTVDNTDIVSGLVNDADDEISDLIADLCCFL